MWGKSGGLLWNSKPTLTNQRKRVRIMAAVESNQVAHCDILPTMFDANDGADTVRGTVLSLTFTACDNIKTTLAEVRRHLAKLDVSSMAVLHLLDELQCHAEELANDVDVALEDHATYPVQ